MKTIGVGTPVFPRAWFLSALTCVFVAACGTAPAGQPGPANDEAVDIGYGEMDADRLTAETSTVRGDADGAPRFRTMIEMLARVPGVRVTEASDGTMSVRIRGSGSFMSGEEPLFVVDGMALPSGAGVTSMDPNYIESISVLKDAGETAIYGARGANGVILIRTKR